MDPSNIIPILLVLPILGALITLAAGGAVGGAIGSPAIGKGGGSGKTSIAGPVAFLCSLVPLAIVIYMVANFPHLATDSTADWHFTFSYKWLQSPLGVQLNLGVDTISLWLIVLTAVLTPISILASFKYIKDRQPEFYAWMLMLHTGMLGVFCARDILIFYLFFEFTLIPMFFIIGIWGGQDRRRAAGKFFLFTFAGSVLTLVSIIYLAYVYSNGYIDASGAHLVTGTGHFSFLRTDLQGVGALLPRHVQCLVFLGMIAGFAVKVPLFPVHTWLPLAHTEAPTAGSVILAGVLLKLGTYGLLRFALPLLPQATLYFAPGIAVICIIGIIYGALVSWAQTDMKKLIAYSSVSHLAFCVLGMFALTQEGLTGSVLYMINHGLSTGALFLVVGMIYERYHTRDMALVGGIARRVPALAFFAVFFVLSSVALPGLNGFVSEFLVLLGTFVSGQTSSTGAAFGGNLGPAYAIPAATGVILGAVYLLYWTGRVIFGPLKEPAHDHAHRDHASTAAANEEPVRDLSLREWAVLVPLAVLVIYMGVYPRAVIDSLQAPVAAVAHAVQPAIHPAGRYAAGPSALPSLAAAPESDAPQPLSPAK